MKAHYEKSSNVIATTVQLSKDSSNGSTSEPIPNCFYLPKLEVNYINSSLMKQK